jgi:type II secretory pathway component PulF
VNDVGLAERSYRGGASDATALMTVVREIPSLAAILAFGSPSAASRRINAQSSKVITLQSSSVHFSSAATAQFSSADDSPDRQTVEEINAFLRSGLSASEFLRKLKDD